MTERGPVGLKDPDAPGDDPRDLARRLADLLWEYPAELPGVKLLLDPVFSGEEAVRMRPQALPASDVSLRDFPLPLLQAAGQTGMVLCQGGLCLLAAEGGLGKSTVLGALGLGVAMAPDGLALRETVLLEGGLFRGKGGPVLIATYEDPASVTAWRVRELADLLREEGKPEAVAAVDRVHIMDMRGWPLYGPAAGAAYSSRPVKLAGWDVLWEAVVSVRPVMIIIDPALKAYVGGSNDPAPVREFLEALTLGLQRFAPGAGIILAAHSTKAARSVRSGVSDPFNPGMVAGSASWTDEVRGLLTMTWDEDQEGRVLAVPKANYGQARIVAKVKPRSHSDGSLLSVTVLSRWRKPGGSENGVAEFGGEKYAGIGG